DRGGSFVVPARLTEVRIGRGPGMNIPVSDPSWQGMVRVLPRKAGYVVINETPHTIYLGEEEFPRGQERTWYHGIPLQPTADTVLVLQVDSTAVGDRGGKVIQEAAPGQKVSVKRVRDLTLLLVLVPLALVLWVLPDTNSGEVSPAEVRKRYGE